MADPPNAPSSESLTALPRELEEELFEVCLGEDPAVARRTLDELCARHPEQEGELRRVAARLASTSGLVPDLATLEARGDIVPPASIPPYTIQREIGRGGFGVVWLAQQDEPVRRLVALKVLLPTAMTESMLQRFHTERQTLAQMQHPGIANIFDAGTAASGEPYFAMEFVDGVPITRYCDDRRLDVDQRLILFRKVCGAVQHAHQRGVIHRDLKPSNILVASQTEAQPKIIDFGLAKILTPLPFAEAPLTEEGRFVGTLEYMSPEQAAGEPVDTRTDVYALGVLLYELLTGSLPFDPRALRAGGWMTALRTIREVDPRSPVDVLAHSDIARAANLRATTPDGLSQRLRGDLSWIAMTALAKDRERRYDAVADLSEDVLRHTQQLPVSVGPPSIGYRVSKFVRRHRAGVAATATVLAVLFITFLQVVAARDEAVAQSVEAGYQEYCAQIAAAQAAMETNQAGRMREALRAAPPTWRHWEWRFLADQSDQSSQVVRTDLGQVRGVGLLNGGTEVVVASYLEPREKIEVWDLTTGQKRYTLEAESEVSSLTASPGGRVFAAGHVHGEVHVHDSDTGRLLHRLPSGAVGHSHPAFDASGRRIAVASDKGRIRLFDTTSGQRIGAELVDESLNNQSVVFTPDGRRLVSCDWHGKVVVWDIESGEPVLTLVGTRNQRRIDIDPQGRFVATACAANDAVRIWDLESGSLHEVAYAGRKSTGVAFHPDGESLAVGLFDGGIRLFRIADGALLGTFRGHSAFVDGIRFTPDGGSLISASWDGTIRRWDPRPRPASRWLDGLPDGAHTLVVDLAEQIAVAGFDDGRLEAWNPARRQLLWTRPATGAPPNRLELYAGAQRVLEVRRDGTVAVIDATTGNAIASAEAGGIEVHASTDGRLVLVRETLNLVVVRDGTTLDVVRAFEMDREVSDACFLDADGSSLLLAAGSVQIRDVATGELRLDIPLEVDAGRLAVSPDWQRFCVADEWGGMSMLDRAGNELVSFRKTRGRSFFAVYQIAFSPDGARLATFSRDLGVRIWDAERGTELLTLPDQPFCAPRFGDDGELLYITAQRLAPDDTRLGVGVKMWDAPASAGDLLDRR